MQRLQQFWHETNEEAKSANDFKTYQLPLARIKKIMKTDKDVKVCARTISIGTKFLHVNTLDD